jgi:hypothetical protein
MPGQFHDVVLTPDESIVRIYADSDNHGQVVFNVPREWLMSSDVPVNQTVIFEVCKYRALLVSIGSRFSLDRELEAEGLVTRKHHVWAALTAGILAFSLLCEVGVPQVKLTLDMLSAPSIKTMASKADWKAIASSGQRVNAPNVYRRCLIGDETISMATNSGTFCTEFDVVDSPWNVDLMAVATPALEEMNAVDDALDFNNISSAAYAQLQRQTMLVNMLYGATSQRRALAAQNKIALVNYAVVHEWAKWIEANQPDDAALKDKVISLWEDASGVDGCDDYCWSLLVNNKGSEAEKAKTSYIKRSDIRILEDARHSLLEKRVKAIVKDWEEQFGAATVQSKADIRIKTQGARPLTPMWRELQRAIAYASRYDVGEFNSMVRSAAAELQALQQVSIEYGVIRDVEPWEQGVALRVDLSMTEPLYQALLTKIALCLVGLVLALMFVWQAHKMGTKRADNSLVTRMSAA